MFDQKKLDRINELAKKNKEEGLTSEELAEREVLRKEGSILETLIYLECKQKGIFDDIRINVEFMWADGKTKNELDIVATKNSKTYFISAKMQAPDKMHIYEIETLCRKFAIEGEAVLVFSHYTTGTDELHGGDFSARPIALEDRVSDMENVSYIGKDGVDIIRPTDNARMIVVAESILDIITN